MEGCVQKRCMETVGLKAGEEGNRAHWRARINNHTGDPRWWEKPEMKKKMSINSAKYIHISISFNVRLSRLLPASPEQSSPLFPQHRILEKTILVPDGATWTIRSRRCARTACLAKWGSYSASDRDELNTRTRHHLVTVPYVWEAAPSDGRGVRLF